MKASRAIPGLPPVVRRGLKKLGQDLSMARRRRRLTMAMVAERAFIGRNTMTRVERGDPAVSMGIYATVLFVLGLGDRVGMLADPGADRVGIAVEEERLPRRVGTPRRRAPDGS
jgi:hypothetical protein